MDSDDEDILTAPTTASPTTAPTDDLDDSEDEEADSEGNAESPSGVDLTIALVAVSSALSHLFQ